MRESPITSIEIRVEGAHQRPLWSTLTLPEERRGPVIVMAHGFLGFKDWAFFPWLSDFFAQAGFPTLRFNFSGSGMGHYRDGAFTELEAFQRDTFSRQVEDLRVVISALNRGQAAPELPPQKEVFLWGHSRGGAVCLLTAALNPQVQGVATWATIARVNRYFYETKQAWRKDGFLPCESSRTGQTLRYSLDFLEDAEQWGKEGDVPAYLNRVEIPVFLVHGSEDTSVPPEESESLAAIHPHAQLAILAKANHKFNSSHPFTDPPGVLIEAAQKTVRFYESLLSE